MFPGHRGTDSVSMKPVRHAFVTALAVALAAPAAFAQSGRYQSVISQEMPTVRDTQTARTLLSPSGQTLANETSLPHEIAFVARGDGFDATITYHNPGSGPA